MGGADIEGLIVPELGILGFRMPAPGIPDVGMAGLDTVSPGIKAGLDIEPLIRGVAGLGGFESCDEQPAENNPATTAATPTPAAATFRYDTFFICLSLLDHRKPRARGFDVDNLSHEFAAASWSDGWIAEDISRRISHPPARGQRTQHMDTLVLIGFLGGLITGISPCILPVLPIVFLAGTQSSEASEHVAEAGRRGRLVRLLRPYGVVAGLVVSFSLVTLAGTTLLHVLRLPRDTVRWVGLVALCLIGLGLIFPTVEKLLERPFALLPQRPVGTKKNGFALGLALGVLYVPCAGPVLAAIVVAGATGRVGWSTIGLTVSFAVGAAVPLLVFALAGNRVAERVGAFRRHQRGTRIAAGVVLLALACALVFDVPQLVQRSLPDYTNALQNSLGHDSQILDRLGGGSFGPCVDSSDLPDCGTAPNFTGVERWLNTPDNAPVDVSALHGKVILVDFWAYSCINCQRAIPHVAAWYDQYHKDGLEVVGVHTPEYSFEHVPGNIADAAGRMGMHYPIAVDNDYGTWNAYHNRYWPAEYLIDGNGHIRHVHFGEGDYGATENQIRTLLSDTARDHVLGPRTSVADQTPTTSTTQETYLGSERADNYGGGETYRAGHHDFRFPPHQPAESFAYRGQWTVDHQGVTAESDDAAISLNYHARNAYLVVGGTGTLTITSDTGTTTQHISGPPTSHLVVASPDNSPRHLEISLSKGLQAYSFTFG